MPIKTQSDLPAKAILENENIFVMDELRAMSQDIRPLEILILNLMPIKEDTEVQILRALSNTPLQINITFLQLESHVSTHTSASHLNQFYVTFSEIHKKKFDGMIITGAPVELMEFEEVNYWDELVKIMDWSVKNVTSTFHLCWGAQAGLYHHFGIQKKILDKKVFGIYKHKVNNRKVPLVRGFDDEFWAPHSRYTTTPIEEIRKNKDLTILAESDEVGAFIVIADEGKQIFVQGHVEYDRMTLDNEYKRDLEKGLNPELPENYYPNDDPSQRPILTWRANGSNLYSNWLNYYVYQVTPFSLEDENNDSQS